MSNETSNKTVQLTDEQEAFRASDKRITVALAGPGSGKTTTIKEMVRQLPLSMTRCMVLLSFTREAASRLKKGLEGKELVYAGTTHSWMLKQIRRYGKLIDIPTNLAPIDEDASVDLIKATAEELRFNGELKGLMKACEENPMVTLERDKHPLISSEQWRVAHLYNRRLIEKGLIDYPGMLTWGLKLLSAGVITDGPKFLIVDEAQDSSKIEWDIYGAHKCERIWIVGDIDQCQPPGTMVRRIVREDFNKNSPRTEDVKIELIAPGDMVPSWSVSRSYYHKRGDRVREVSNRHYDGDLVVAKSGGLVSKYTPNHKCIAKLTGAFDGKHLLYVMRSGDRFRIGKVTGVLDSQKGTYGITLRAKAEGADAFWVLAQYPTNMEARLMESFYSIKYGIPTLMWRNNQSRAMASQEHLDRFWNLYKCDISKVAELLSLFGRDINYPLHVRGGRNLMRRRATVIHACNLMDGMALLHADPAAIKRQKVWITATFSREKYSGRVYSLNVDNRQTYVADGMFTHNSIFAWRNACPEILNKRCQMEDTAVYTITRNYRSGPAICDAATRLIDCNHQRVNKPVVAADTSKPSTIEHWEFKDIEAETAAMLEWAKEDLDRAVICRSNKQVSDFKRALVEGGIKVVGRGSKPADFNEFTAFIGVLGNPQNDTVANTFAIRHLGSKKAKDIRQRSEATCTSMTDLLCEDIAWLEEMIQRAQIVSSMPELVELCARGYSNATLDIFRQCAEGSDSVDDLLVAIEEDVEGKKQEGVWVGTIHRAKGLEWGSVWLPQWCEQMFPFRANDIQEEDRRLAFVGITRGKDSVVTSSTKKSLVGFNAKPMSTGPSVFVSEAGIPIFEA